jgi:tetratricopeptide (TPR) repeat protein
MRGRILGILVLLAWGIAKFSFEARLEQHMENTRLGGFKPTASLRQQAGQAGFIAALGGLRSAVADLLWIRAYTAWRDVQYGRMKLLFDTCTAMQPRRVLFWDISAWHMAWNGAAYVQNHEPDPVVRKAEMRKFFMAGKDFLQRGIESNPDSWELYERLGALYKDKLKDFENASKAYDEASKRPGHLKYTRRFAAYYLAEVPGREREAYERLMALFNESEHEWLLTLFRHIQNLEAKLDIPDAQRIWHTVVKLAETPGKEGSAYAGLTDLIKTGSREPAVIDAARAYEQKMDIPAERRVKLPVQDKRPSD